MNNLKDKVIYAAEVLNNRRKKLKDRRLGLYALWGKACNKDELLSKILKDLCIFGDTLITKLSLNDYEFIASSLETLKENLETMEMYYHEGSETLSIKCFPKDDNGFIDARLAILADQEETCQKTAREIKATLCHFMDRRIEIFDPDYSFAMNYDFIIDIIGKRDIDRDPLEINKDCIYITIPSSSLYSFHNIEDFLRLKKVSLNIDNGYGAAIYVLKVLNMKTLSTGNVLFASAGLADDNIMQDALRRIKADERIQNVFCLKDIGINTIDKTMGSLITIQELMQLYYPCLRDGDFGFDSTLVFAGFDGVFSVLMTSKINGPVISIPSGIGYGTNSSGLVTYLSMVNGCSAGTVTVSPADIRSACDIAAKTVSIRKKSHNKEIKWVSKEKVTVID